MNTMKKNKNKNKNLVLHGKNWKYLGSLLSLSFKSSRRDVFLPQGCPEG